MQAMRGNPGDATSTQGSNAFVIFFIIIAHGQEHGIYKGVHCFVSFFLYYASVIALASMLVLSSLRLANNREQCSTIVARGLALDTIAQRLAVLSLVGSLDLVHERLCPVAHQQSCQLLVIRACACHRLFQMLRHTVGWVGDPGDYFVEKGGKSY